MSTVTIKTDKRGNRTATVKLGPSDEVVIVNSKNYYRLGGQLDEVMPAEVITDMRPVTWCHFSQKWEEA